MGTSVEVIVVEGHSTDGTWERLIQMGRHRSSPGPQIHVLKQKGVGKADAVRQGFAQATGDLLFILDADLTVMPEELARFYRLATSGKADFLNGVRFEMPLEPGTMPFLNLIANKTFSRFFTTLFRQPVRDALCGTKVLFRSDYVRMTQLRPVLPALDPFGDFTLLFGAAKLQLRILDVPVQYSPRTYGRTNIRRWRDGWLLLKTFALGARWLRLPRAVGRPCLSVFPEARQAG
jgi:glycosyltransferase involved in cell wall biosynthesis